ncbi:hypothetical protein B0H63DRAFT_255867 [Podospora didyma]|uniref:Uncharacterized protein n=1 Tax=Podospora didyma TaxID=330526 RepID=A0AAE0KDU6_9PEZI|nr:hypothetical protein B0H63DRAFT_255867 [Podospora didyma]
MLLNTITTAAAAAALVFFGSTNAAAIDARVPLIGSFGVSKTWGCPIQNQVVVNFADGGESNNCLPFHNNNVYTTIHVYSWNPKCLLTLFQKVDCSDPGVVSGLGCWQPDGGMHAFKVTCPYK